MVVLVQTDLVHMLMLLHLCDAHVKNTLINLHLESNLEFVNGSILHVLSLLAFQMMSTM